MSTLRRSAFRLAVAGVALSVPLATAACSGDGGSGPAPATTQAAGDCPAAPVSVVVSVDQWGKIVSALGGSCAKVTTVLASSAVDPHDFEPAPKDAAVFEGAKLVVVNGGHYDEWATKLAQTSAPDAAVINAVDTSGLDGGAHQGDDHDHAGNPHVWYAPAAVTAVADAVTAQLGRLAPGAAEYFGRQRAAFADSLQPYDHLIDSIKTGAAGKSYAATESVFDDMAAAVGLADRTPAGYRTAAANETDPSPADLDAFLRLLGDRGVDVLIFNTQTEGSVPDQIRSAAEQAGVPVVDVTETVPSGATSFESWQVDQLDALAKALGVDT